MRDANRMYFELEITGASESIAIWLGDDAGRLVVKERGTLRMRLAPGNYVVEFRLGGPCYPVVVDRDTRLTQVELERGPWCKRPAFRAGVVEDEERSS